MRWNKKRVSATSGEKKQKVRDVKGTVKRIWEYMARDKKLFVAVLLLVVISSILSLVGPYLLGVGVDKLLAGTTGKTLLIIISVLVLVFLCQSVTTWFQNYWMVTVAQQTVYTMRKDLMENVLQLPMLFFQKRQSGELMSRLTNDMENVSRTLNTSVIQLATSLLTLVGTVVVMVMLSPLLTLLTLTIVPMMFAGMKWITSRTGHYFKLQQKNLGEMNGYVEEALSGHTMVKLFNQEERMITNFNPKNEQLKESGYWAQVYTGFIPKLMNTLNNLSFTIIVAIGGLFALKGMVSIGEIVTFTAYSRQFTRPLNDLANQFNVILSAVAGAERVFEIMDEAKEDDKDTDTKELATIHGDVTFDAVNFSYDKDVATLCHVSFHVNQGETVALVGPTGAGKTTIISLLARFYEVDAGTIWIDQHDIKSISRGSLRNQLAMVLQDSFLFDTTIKENIRYGRLDASDQQVVAAAKAANAHDFINQLPDGYETVLESNGSGISQGQRQLLAIARAMIADPALLILDEATSSIDTITEMKINEAMKKLMQGRTCFVIAHRLNTVREADIILVLQHGEIIEKGSHQELLRQDGFYAGLYHSKLEA